MFANFKNVEWMKREAESISELPLNLVALPGSHDAGTSDITLCSPWCPARTGWYVFFAKLFRPVTLNYSRVQNYNLYEQASSGIRYFDLRVCPLGDGVDRKYYFTHGMLGGDFIEGINVLCNFARANPQEILVLDVRIIRGFTANDHALVQEAINVAAGTHLANRSEFDALSTVQEFWDARKNIVVIYPKKFILSKYDFWGNKDITTKWPNTVDADLCITKLDKNIAVRNTERNQLHNLQACLTPTTSYILKHFWSSTQTLSEKINVKLVRHVEQWQGRVNCIMVDVVEYPGLIDAVISLNKF